MGEDQEEAFDPDDLRAANSRLVGQFSWALFAMVVAATLILTAMILSSRSRFEQMFLEMQIEGVPAHARRTLEAAGVGTPMPPAS